jgi:hypothetical protein
MYTPFDNTSSDISFSVSFSTESFLKDGSFFIRLPRLYGTDEDHEVTWDDREGMDDDWIFKSFRSSMEEEASESSSDDED